jgi:hypothetical protein
VEIEEEAAAGAANAEMTVAEEATGQTAVAIAEEEENNFIDDLR